MRTLLFLLGIVLCAPCMGFAQSTDEAEGFDGKRQKINLDEIPAPVKTGFSNSEYGSMQIVEAHVLSVKEAKEMLEGSRDIKVITEETMLYELKVEKGDHSALLYFTEKGELYNVTKEEGIG